MVLFDIIVEVQELTDTAAGIITLSGNPANEFKIVDWLYENFDLIILVCGIIIFIVWFIYVEFGKLLANRKIEVKRIVVEDVEKRGDVWFDEDKLMARFFWTKRTFYWKDITEISGFSTGDDADGCWEELINIKFKRGVTIVFNTVIKEHIEIVDRERSKLGLGDIDIISELYQAEEKKPIIFYKKH